MTNEEAIEILKQFKKCLSDVVFDEKGSEAWQMAIKALENHDTFMKYAYSQGKQDALSQEPQCTEHPCLGTLCRYYKEPCTDAVSREWLMRKATERFYTTNYFNHISAMIEEAPSVTHKSGKWINDKDDMPTCSECGYIPQYDRAIDDYEYSNYCPSCGARMFEPQESEDKE